MTSVEARGTATATATEKTLVVLNPASHGGRSDIERVQHWLEGQPNCTLKLTDYPGDVMRYVQQAMASNTRRFIIAGGDGTIHEAVSLLARREVSDYTLGILPLGTGNDLARTLGIPLDFDAATQVIRHGHRKRIDLIRLTCNNDQTHYIVNAATGGVSERVRGSVTPAYKSTLGPLAYVVAAAQVFRKMPRYRVQLRVDAERFAAETPTVVIANGQTAGGGHPVAPSAVIDDGRAEAIVATPRTRAEQLKLLLRLEVARHLDSDNIVHCSGRRIELSSDPPMPFSLDGEQCDPVVHGVFEVLPRSLTVLVPPPSDAEDVGGEAGVTPNVCWNCGAPQDRG